MESKNGLPPHRINHVQIMKDVKSGEYSVHHVDAVLELGSLKVLAIPVDISRLTSQFLIALDQNRTLDFIEESYEY